MRERLFSLNQWPHLQWGLKYASYQQKHVKTQRLTFFTILLSLLIYTLARSLYNHPTKLMGMKSFRFLTWYQNQERDVQTSHKRALLIKLIEKAHPLKLNNIPTMLSKSLSETIWTKSFVPTSARQGRETSSYEKKTSHSLEFHSLCWDITKLDLIFHLSIHHLLNQFILSSSMLAKLVNIYMFQCNNKMLFVTSSFVSWLIGHILFMKWVGLVLV